MSLSDVPLVGGPVGPEIAALEEAAAVLRAEAAEVVGLLDPARAQLGPDVLAGGRLAETTEDLIETDQQTLRALGRRLEATAAGLEADAAEQQQLLDERIEAYRRGLNDPTVTG